MTALEHPSLTTQDERIMAGLSHISIVIPMAGLVAPIVIWVTQKDKSDYIAFQSLQALAYQISLILMYIIGWACYALSFFGMFLAIPFAPAEGSAEAAATIFVVATIFPFIIFGLIFLVFIALGIYGLIGGVMTLQGKPFRYLIIGKMVEKFRDNSKENA